MGLKVVSVPGHDVSTVLGGADLFTEHVQRYGSSFQHGLNHMPT